VIWKWPRRKDSAAVSDGYHGLPLLAATLCLATLMLVWFGWAATRDLRRAARQRLTQQMEATLVLLGIAIEHDMQGAWVSVLVPVELPDIQDDPPYNFLQLSTRAFARFSYLESFIVWKRDGHPEGLTYTFNRADRAAPWDPAAQSEVAYPVAMQRNPPAMQALVGSIRREAEQGRRFVLVETPLGGVPHQVIVHLIFDGAGNHQLVAFVGFMVNLDWVRRYYFAELLQQITTLAGGQEKVSLAITDENGRDLSASQNRPAADPVAKRVFPLLFFDQRLVRPVGSHHIQEWTAWVRPASASAAAAQTAGEQTFLLIALAAFAAMASLLQVVRAARVRAELAAMKSEFVSMVTHELKTPLALIKLVGETLEKGRYTSPDVVREYAGLLSQETNRLAQLIDNLLTFSRVSNLGQVYTFQSVDPGDLVDEALTQFWPRLNQLGFDVNVEMAPGLPPVRADRAAMLQVLGNVIDNAIKYSGARRKLSIAGCAHAQGVTIAVADAGVGIASQHLERVFEKFYRGPGTNVGGSGLGLTIARRVVEGHGGRIVVDSVAGEGTRVEIMVPAVQS
jgi:signal transduction histidine kinase